MRPVRNVIPRALRDDEEVLIPRARPKKGPLGVKGRLAGAGVGRGYGRAIIKSNGEPAILRAGSSQQVRRKRSAPMDVDSDMESAEPMESPATLTSANHNKYCHFCQHVKVRASSMLACQNPECCRRFCEHCLVTHLSEDIDPLSSCAWTVQDGKSVWNCPICRKRCCCSQSDCKQEHRHCKAYRYRRRRAELATKRQSASSTLGMGEKRTKKSAATKEGKGKGCSGNGSVIRPTLTFGYVRTDRTSSTGSIDSPPSLGEGQHTVFPSASTSSRPRREAALKGRCYTFGDESSDDRLEGDFDEGDDNISTPATRDPDEEEYELHVMENCQNHLAAGSLSGASGVVSGSEPIPGDLWSAEQSSAAYADDAGEDDQSESLADDVLGGIYGHMAHSRDHYLGSEEFLAGGDVPVLDSEECGDAAVAEADEARWIRRTYETVYNPVARQRALQALTSDLNLGGSKGFAPPPPGRYPLDEGELFFLSSTRGADSASLSQFRSCLLREPGEKPAPAAPAASTTSAAATAATTCAAAVCKGVECGSGSPSDGSDLSYFLQANKFVRGDDAAAAPVPAGPAKKCTVVYDFQ